MALAVPNTWWMIIGPATITFLILRESSIPMLNKSWPNIPVLPPTVKKQVPLSPGRAKENKDLLIMKKCSSAFTN